VIPLSKLFFDEEVVIAQEIRQFGAINVRQVGRAKGLCNANFNRLLTDHFRTKQVDVESRSV
jgi:hypothetical protein